MCSPGSPPERRWPAPPRSRGRAAAAALQWARARQAFAQALALSASPDYAVALAEAQALGFAERDPTADVEGFDAGAKAAIIATIAFGSKVVAGDGSLGGYSLGLKMKKQLLALEGVSEAE